MTTRRKLPKPTDSEWTVLKVLWRMGPSTVRQVHEQLSLKKESAYTTTLKIMQIMAEKGLVKRNESKKTHLYSAAIAEKEAKEQLIVDLLERAFDGSTHNLVLQALSTRKASHAQLTEIRKLLDQMEKEKP